MRQLDELHFPPFESAVKNAGARSIMTSYNSVDGSPATQNRWLLTDVLKRDWRFQGFVISDAAATGGATVLHMTEPNTPTAAKHAWESGLDVVFQSTWPQHRNYWEAVRTGMVAPSVIDSAVLRVLRAKFQLGLFEQPYVDVDSAVALERPRHAPPTRARSGRRFGGAAQERRWNSSTAPWATSIAVIGVDATGIATRRLQRARHQASVHSRWHRKRRGRGIAGSIRPGPGRFPAAPVVVPREFFTPARAAGPAFVANTSTTIAWLVRRA